MSFFAAMLYLVAAADAVHGDWDKVAPPSASTRAHSHESRCGSLHSCLTLVHAHGSTEPERKSKSKSKSKRESQSQSTGSRAIRIPYRTPPRERIPTVTADTETADTDAAKEKCNDTDKATPTVWTDVEELFGALEL